MLFAASYSACVVYTKTIIYLSGGESGGYLPWLRWIVVNHCIACIDVWRDFKWPRKFAFRVLPVLFKWLEAMHVTKNSVVSLRAELSVLLAMFHVKSKANRRDGCIQATQLSSPEQKWMYNKACPTPRRRKRGLWLKTNQMFSVHTAPEKFQIYFGFVLEIKLGQEISLWLSCATSYFSKSFVLEIFSVLTKTQSRQFEIPLVWRAFSESSVFVTD